MKLRQLRETDYLTVKDIFESQGGILPSPDEMYIFVAQEAGAVVGLLGFERIPHMGPLWVDSKHRGKGIAGKLIKFIESKLVKSPKGGYYMFPSNAESKRVAEKAGLVKTNWEVWKREF